LQDKLDHQAIALDELKQRVQDLSSELESSNYEWRAKLEAQRAELTENLKRAESALVVAETERKELVSQLH
jgi:hypothetical protein